MPGTVSFTYSGTIAAPMEKVYAVLTDPTQMPDWLPSCKAVQAPREGRGKGERWMLRMIDAHGPVTVEIEIVDFSPPSTFGWVEHRRRAGAKTFFKLEFGGGTTRITMKHVWTPETWRAWILGQFFRRRNATRLFDGLLQNLRKVLTR